MPKIWSTGLWAIDALYSQRLWGRCVCFELSVKCIVFGAIEESGSLRGEACIKTFAVVGKTKSVRDSAERPGFL